MNMTGYLTARTSLVEEFRKSTVGPGVDDEVLADPPSRTYICGSLRPMNSATDTEQNDELQEGDNESSLEGIPSLINAMWPSAMGLTLHVRHEVTAVQLRISAAIYIHTPPDEPSQNTTLTDGKTKKPSEPLLGGLLQGLGKTTEVPLGVTAEGTAKAAEEANPKKRETWKRVGFSTTQLICVGAQDKKLYPFDGETGPISRVELDLRQHDHGPNKPKLITATLVNRNEVSATDWQERECNTIFQPKIEAFPTDSEEQEVFVESPAGASRTSDPDYVQHLLLYRHARDFATGHGCAADWQRTSPTHRTATRIWTEFVPQFKVPELRYDLFNSKDDDKSAKLIGALRSALPDDFREEEPDNIFIMKYLAGARNDDWILGALEGLCCTYAAWLKDRRLEIDEAVAEIRDPDQSDSVRERAAVPNIDVLGREVLARMRAGIQTLRSNPIAFRCFRLANEAMFQQQQMAALQSARRAGKPIEDLDTLAPAKWRPFQLAFLLMTINSIAVPDLRVDAPSSSSGDTTSERPTERQLMDLIWFPTGGGKTEAYLGLTAFTLFHRRLREPTNPDLGAGVSVITRYTLRLLTTQQFERATRLICACEGIREQKRDIRNQTLNVGLTPFVIGLWIGGNSSPNRFRDIGTGEDVVEGAYSILTRLKDGHEPESGSDLRHIRDCPWCGNAIDVSRMRITDSLGKTINSPDELNARGLRLVFQCGGRLPAPLKGNCPFRRDSGLPVQIVDEQIYDEPPSVVIGTVDKFARLTWNADTRSLFGRLSFAAHLPPPDLIIQDELHLISGPLGTMVGLFETAVDVLARDNAGRTPKVIGSTATIRRADEQVWNLFQRKVRQFPPPALTAGESFFAQVAPDLPGRTYLGLMAPGTSGKQLFLRCCGALTQLVSELPDDVRDPYWTLVSYFNSIRELAGGNVLAQDDVPNYMKSFAQIRQRLGHINPVRVLSQPQELTSRLKSADIPKILQLLQQPYRPPSGGNAIDVLLATNMISVGVDVDRLGLMMIQGQPKTTAEYIQASSRVGRKFPGLVITLLNWTRSRDRSHYERFVPYHEAFYREVEATSVTPWSSPTRDRALSAVLIAILRHLDGSLVADPLALGTANIDHLWSLVQPVVDRVIAQDPREAAVTKQEVKDRLQRWQKWAALYSSNAKYGSGMQWDVGPNRLLRQLTAPRRERDGLEGAPNSMRNVEPETGFRLKIVPVLSSPPKSSDDNEDGSTTDATKG
ncbi:MAG: hypothetical protein K8U03_00610 [Planctomycetia bacterium]|nr:hypothetical protein [Planctomycetia bacterium]